MTNVLDPLVAAIREGAAEMHTRTGDTVEQVASSVSRVLDHAGAEGLKIKKALVRNWGTLDRRRPRTRGENATWIAAAVGVALVLGYLVKSNLATAPEE